MVSERQAERLTIDPTAPDAELVAMAGRALREGKLVAIPTETVYGLGCNALDADAIRRVFTAKSRPLSDPLIVHVDSDEMVSTVVGEPVPGLASLLMDRFWPGPLTIVLPRGAEVPDEITGGLDTVGVRFPSHPVASAIITAAGVPIAAPSANTFSHVSPTSADHVFADLGAEVDVIVDSGRTDKGLESTVVSVDGDSVTVLRHGAVTEEELAAVIAAAGTGRLVPTGGTPANASPGHADRHYSPNAPTLAVLPGVLGSTDVAELAAAAGAGTGVEAGVLYVGYDEDEPSLPADWHFRSLGSRNDLARVGHDLYDTLRSLDGPNVRLIILELTGADGLGRAIDDRMTRAASSVVFRDRSGLLAALGNYDATADVEEV